MNGWKSTFKAFFPLSMDKHPSGETLTMASEGLNNGSCRITTLHFSFCLSTGGENNRMQRLVKEKAERRAKNSIVIVFIFSSKYAIRLSSIVCNDVFTFEIGLFFVSLDQSMQAIRLYPRKTKGNCKYGYYKQKGLLCCSLNVEIKHTDFC